MAKVQPLLLLQSQSFFEFFGNLPGKGWKPDRLNCDPSRGLILVTEDSEEFALYSEGWADEHLWKVFQNYIQMLPNSLAVHELTQDRVGALATLRLDALVGMTTDPQQDFVAISFGVLRVTLWAKAVANATGAPLYLMLPRKDGLDPALYTKEYWRGMLRALAGEIHGQPMMPLDYAKVSAWDLYTRHEHADLNFRMILEGFVVFHETGHYELRHGDIVRLRQGDVPRFLSHAMEHDADAFALGTLLDVMGLEREAVANGLCLLFALLALAPSQAQTFPECSDGTDYPHPMRRLSWLLHKVFLGDGESKSKCLRFAAEIIGMAYGESWGDATEAMVEEIWGRMLLAPLMSASYMAPEES